MVFSKWKPYLHPRIELIPVELAGRGRRIHEAHYGDAREAIEDAFQLIKSEIYQARYALFGHSMGSMISYELAHKITNSNLPPPVHLFFSGKGAPHLQRSEEKKYHLMSDDVFKKELIELGGTPSELFEHPELLELFIPLLKNDFKITENGAEREGIHPLDENITIFLGTEDDMTQQQCDGWKYHTKNNCSIHYFEGGHFFLHEETEQVVRIINDTLKDFLQ